MEKICTMKNLINEDCPYPILEKTMCTFMQLVNKMRKQLKNGMNTVLPLSIDPIYLKDKSTGRYLFTIDLNQGGKNDDLEYSAKGKVIQKQFKYTYNYHP